MQENTDNGASPVVSPRKAAGRFRKGTSGNPSGRPKQNHALIAALENIVEKRWWPNLPLDPDCIYMRGA